MEVIGNGLLKRLQFLPKYFLLTLFLACSSAAVMDFSTAAAQTFRVLRCGGSMDDVSAGQLGQLQQNHFPMLFLRLISRPTQVGDDRMPQWTARFRCRAARPSGNPHGDRRAGT